MDFSSISLSGWTLFDGIGAPPDTLVAAIVSALATLALIAGFAPRRLAPGRGVPARDAEDGATVFLIDGRSVKPLGARARDMLESFEGGISTLAALADHLAEGDAGLRAAIDTLVLDGTPFRRHTVRGDGAQFEITGAARGAAALLTVRPASEEARALQDTRAALRRAETETAFLRDVLDRAPVLAWRKSAGDEVIWANAPYRDRFDVKDPILPDYRIRDAFGHVLEEMPLTGEGADRRRRVSVSDPSDAEPHWFELRLHERENGETIGFALENDDLVAAEASLRRFVETLTETFAHLPIGLAVFDKNRRLGLFNPALTALVKIDAVWLAGRPSLRDFLERLRETRQMPEQADFAAWRRKLTELEESARDGTYEENWVLPSGKIFRVTGRPHPQGALAFLFEDISATVMLERKYRSELELSQATLDRLGEAISVFDASGSLIFVNSAFETLWDIEPMKQLDGPGIADLAAIWQERCLPSPAWDKLTAFATAEESRTSWEALVETRDGQRLSMIISPLPDTSALVVFRAAFSPEHTVSDGSFDTLALDHIEVPARTALTALQSAVDGEECPAAEEALGTALRDLGDGLDRASRLRDLAPADTGEGVGPLPALSAALATRGLRLDAPQAAGAWRARLRKAAMAMGLAAADHASPGATLSVTLEAGEGEDGYTLSVRADAPEETEGPLTGPGATLARQIVTRAGGAMTLTHAGGAIVVSASLPREVPDQSADETGPATRTG